MSTLNVVTSPEVAGNISSCETKVSTITGASRDSLWYTNDVAYATNNCTGQTDVYHSWSVSGFSLFMALVVCVCVTFVLGLFAS